MGPTWILVQWCNIHGCTPLCKSNGTFFSDMVINDLTSVLHKYKTPVTKCCILTFCWVNLVCIRHLIVKIMPGKHECGPDFLMSDSPHMYIFQLSLWELIQLYSYTRWQILEILFDYCKKPLSQDIEQKKMIIFFWINFINFYWLKYI